MIHLCEQSRIPVRTVPGIQHRALTPYRLLVYMSRCASDASEVSVRGGALAFFRPAWYLDLHDDVTAACLRAQLPTEMSTRNIKIMFLGSKVRPVRRVDNLTAICEPIV
jgi:hypothetical protein